MLLVVIAIISIAAVAIPWLNRGLALSAAEKMEADAMKGVPTTRRSAAHEAAVKAEAAEAARAQPEIAPAPAMSATRDPGSAIVHQGGTFRSLVEPTAYATLSAPCKQLVDTIVGMLDKPEDSSSFRQSLNDTERRFSATCVDHAAEAKAEAEADAKRAAETKQITCAQQRTEAAEYRNLVARTPGDDYRPKPGVIDEDTKALRSSLEQNKQRLRELEAYIAANC